MKYRFSHLASVAALAAATSGCTTLPHQAATPEAEASRQLVNGLLSLTYTTDRLAASRIKPPAELCEGVIDQADTVAGRLIAMTVLYNNAGNADAAKAAELSRRTFNLNEALSGIQKACPAETRAHSLPSTLDAQLSADGRRVRLVADYTTRPQ